MPRKAIGDRPMTQAERQARQRARQRFVVICREGLHCRVFGPFTSFKRADGAARAWGSWTTAKITVEPVESPDAPEPWNARHHFVTE